MNETVQLQSALGDEFDQTFRKFDGLPDATWTEMSNKRLAHPVTGVSQDWTVQRIRQRGEGDWLLLTRGSGSTYLRVVVPPDITRIIDRTYDAVTKINRRSAGRAAIEARKAAGEDIGAALRDPKVQAKARAARKAGARKRRSRR